MTISLLYGGFDSAQPPHFFMEENSTIFFAPDEKLRQDVICLLDIVRQKNPIQKDGTFSPEAVKACIIEMADYIIEDKMNKFNFN